MTNAEAEKRALIDEQRQILRAALAAGDYQTAIAARHEIGRLTQEIRRIRMEAQ